jgi:hypothetical protein
MKANQKARKSKEWFRREVKKNAKMPLVPREEGGSLGFY